MNRETRRHFLARSAAAGTLALGALRGQNPEPVPIPGLEVGEPTTSLALRNVTVIDATGGPAMPGVTVVISGNRIESLGPTGTTQLAPGVQVFDANGKFLIPGMWDMHVHHWRGEISPLFIPNGVTGVRLMGGPEAIVRRFAPRRQEIEEGKRLGPRLIVASPTLNANAVHNPEEGRIAVRKAVQEGADCIKVYSGISRESYFAIVDESKKVDVPFVGHVPNPPGLEECADAGQSSIEHMAGVHSYLTRATGADSDVSVESLSAAQAEALCDIFRRNHALLCPTMTVGFGLRGEPSLTEDPRLKYIDSATKGQWEQVFKNPNLPTVRRRQDYNLGLVGAMHKAGVGILAGTDTSFGPGTPYAMPGFGLHDELRHLVTAGLSPMDALRTATYRPAEFLGLLDSLGTVDRGKLAELVLLDANPLDNVANTQKINMVFTGGRVYRRPALDAMLNAIEANARN